MVNLFFMVAQEVQPNLHFDWTINFQLLISTGVFIFLLVKCYFGIITRLDRLETQFAPIWDWWNRREIPDGRRTHDRKG